MSVRCIAAIVALQTVLGVGATRADDYPSKLVTIVVPTTAGDSTDLIARGLAQNLSAKWGKSVIVENRPGGGTLIGASAVAKANPDGYTLLMMFSGTLLNAALHKQMPIDFEKDLTPVARVVESHFVLVANPSLPVKDLQELIAYARKNPDALSYATVGPGSLQHLAVEVLNSMAGIKMVPVPYAGSTPALTGVITNQVQLMFAPVGAAKPYIESRQLRAIGVGSPKRVAFVPDIPTIAESGLPDFDVVSWQLMAVTGGTPRDIVNKLNRDVQEAAAQPDIRATMEKLSVVPQEPNTVEENEALMKAELNKWRPVLGQIGLIK
jgi:tripartite-type tricarboxylate transporter receptor subunit TctC